MRVKALDLGLCDYDYAYRLQLQLVEQLKQSGGTEYMILCEHNNIFTIGRCGSRENILADEGSLREEGIDVRDVERGGDVTYHGPGQLIIYPIFDLKRRKRDLILLFEQLEEACIRLLGRYGLDAVRIKGLRGVWVDGMKVASIGLAFRSWVSFHGMSINLNCDTRYFRMIRPCGLRDRICISVSELLRRPVDIECAKRAFLEIAGEVFNIGQRDDKVVSLVA